MKRNAEIFQFSINIYGDTTKFENETDYTAVISLKPVNARRKIKDIRVIPKRSTLLIEEKTDLNQIYLSFRE